MHTLTNKIIDAANQLEEAHGIKEILQDIALYGLWRADFFEVAGFHGKDQLSDF